MSRHIDIVLSLLKRSRALWFLLRENHNFERRYTDLKILEKYV